MQYPTSFNDIIGQDDAKQALGVEIARARRRNEPLPHMLLTGGPGLGKSMFAHTLAAELRVGFRKVAPGRLKPQDVYRAIFGPPRDLNDHDVLLLEEAHAAFAGGETAMAWLLDVLTDFELCGQRIPQITFVLATHRGIRSPALASRLLEVRLEPYTHHEALELISAASKELLAPRR